MQISETRAIVTGGASGLGAATARALCAAEAAVTILDRDTDRGMELAAEIGAGFQPVDVTDETSVEQAVGEASAQMGGITACISCAGIATAERTLGRSGPHGLESFRRTVEINLIGSFNVLRLAAAEMAQNTPDDDGCRGVIVNTASVAAYDGQKGQAAYAASKGGIAAMTLPLARDLAGLRIRVMAIAPGIFRTPMLEGLGQEVMDGLAADVPNPPRLGDPAEYAALVLHILQNGYMNGEVIRLDAGLRMR
ncbi:3-hydroxyacyl-CoA dehydrogenase [Rhodovulum sp. BSW8]|uniref:NAD(P)-dependent dehydrogenase (Short-subunit alcohol dehydrogenase family) n=1 Tax=Rhodovulum visakhapatnamense TaxID=364297 RepID=A0A4R8GAI9_9RHOB|nr:MULTISPECIES: SDR family NAD(P)-dependent oxidoreductase [Rhodovulum]RBO54721.1 3-hydroxyacyl-CoA dehydrogenase [Rhodovulum sp. BSW8]TDX32598.1 NAD(P)-dependent dehydrogenase (short-subunit alcohol dehydrogenase family) [Rhodovulum visakhapatnamense]